MSQAGQVPYTKSLKVRVISREKEFSYKNKKNEERVLVNSAIADATRAVKCTIYDSSKFARFKEGQSIILRNIIKKSDAVVVTTNTKVFPCTQVDVPENIVSQARILLNPPPAPSKSVSEALASPPKVRVSVTGRIVQEEATREVLVKEERVKIKNIFIEDTSSKCKVALWRKCAEEFIRPGDYIEITDVVTNTFRNEVSLSSTSRTKITKTECPPEVKIYEAVSVCVDSNEVTFLLNDDSVLCLPLELVEMALPEVDKEDIEIHILNKCDPTISLRCTSKGSAFTSIELV
ncbi:hypothetical protein KUTeg_008129 [Tegillarca granosa]|uniref:Uncharacterized protein n=1 Tax=Tegillarca granosa TaxID=220873 RepID=A0ABQ9F884_TEGGR|nr:hypothetical protein KUTeg_008129 [Tegillarca granosa]